MTTGLLIRNAAGTTVINTASNVLNLETIDTSSVSLAGGASTTLSVPDAHITGYILVDVDGFGSEDITTATATDQIIVTNTANANRNMTVTFWRLK